MKGFCNVNVCADGIVITGHQMVFSLINIKMDPGTLVFYQLEETALDACLKGGPAWSWVGGLQL